MKRVFSKAYAILAAFLTTLLCTALPALADSPLTGDDRGQFMGIVVALLVVSVILIVVFAVMSSKKKK